jgi:hypothetical protein
MHKLDGHQTNNQFGGQFEPDNFFSYAYFEIHDLHYEVTSLLLYYYDTTRARSHVYSLQSPA